LAWKTLDRPTLSDDCGLRTIKRTDERRLISARMSVIRRIAVYTFSNNKINEEITTKLQIPQMTEHVHRRALTTSQKVL
jgi:exonuclease III